MELIHLWFLPMLLIKLFGRPKDFQLIEFLLKTQLLLFLATDIHLSLIHNSKDKNGWEVEKDLKWLPFNSVPNNGSKRSRWLFQTVILSWSNLLDKILMPFLIHFSPNNLSRREEISQLDSDLKMLKFLQLSNFISKLNWLTLITNQKQLPNVQLLTSLSQSLVLRINFLQWLSRSKSQILNKLKKTWSASRMNTWLPLLVLSQDYSNNCLMLIQILFSKTLLLLSLSKSPKRLQQRSRSNKILLLRLRRKSIPWERSIEELQLKVPCFISCSSSYVLLIICINTLLSLSLPSSSRLLIRLNHLKRKSIECWPLEKSLEWPSINGSSEVFS